MVSKAVTDDPASRLRAAIEHAAHLLPAQGPITVFIHHNTLHAFEDLQFMDGVRQGGKVFGCEPFLSEDRYREALGRGRIRMPELAAVVAEDLGPRATEVVAPLTTRIDLRLAMLQYPLRAGTPNELRWFIAETNALRRVRGEASAAARTRLVSETRRWAMRDLRDFGGASPETWDESAWEAFALQSLWRVCREGVAFVPPPPPPPVPVRHRDWLFEATGTDADLHVNAILIRFCAAFLDQGVSHCALPDRERGFFHAFCALHRRPGGCPDRWMRGLGAELSRLQDTSTPIDSIRESIELLGVPPSEQDSFIGATFLALRGWAGMIRQVEERGDRVAFGAPAGTLVEYLAIRLVLERFALAHFAREELRFAGPLAELREAARKRAHPARPEGTDQRAFAVFQVAQLLGWSPEELGRKSADGWVSLVGEIEGFHSLERRRVFHLAYERRFRHQTLDAVALHTPRSPLADRPRFQVICCIDEREESFRRHLEEVAPDAGTLGAAGFFSVPMYYRGTSDAHFVPLCPIVITPKHWVAEHPCAGHEGTHEQSARTRKRIGDAMHRVNVGGRGIAGGAILAGAVGVLASIPLVMRILFPRVTAKLRAMLGGYVNALPRTAMKLDRTAATPSEENGGQGFSLDEMVNMGERLLRDIGLTSNFARLVVPIGHGSNSVNNPHKSAYDCGACGGSGGGPNARALAHILNKPEVRERLATRGIAIPADTHFLGGFHNTCDDSVGLFVDDGLPETHAEDFHHAKLDIESALERNAHERCRRFMSAPLTITPAEAKRHVEGRSEDLAQPRPELGHATNAIAIVGRRNRTRGLYFDRRAFLISYDPTGDDADAAILTRVLQAVTPVCAGINLEYYFSHVDNAGFGCGTKLPHNVTALLGVMDGAASDLRTGLPWQMVEIHEPVRLTFILENTPEAVLAIMERNPGIGQLVRNGWVHVATLDPDSSAIHLFENGEFQPYHPSAESLPSARSSIDWYRGWREHLEFAEVGIS